MPSGAVRVGQQLLPAASRKPGANSPTIATCHKSPAHLSSCHTFAPIPYQAIATLIFWDELGAGYVTVVAKDWLRGRSYTQAGAF